MEFVKPFVVLLVLLILLSGCDFLWKEQSVDQQFSLKQKIEAAKPMDFKELKNKPEYKLPESKPDPVELLVENCQSQVVHVEEEKKEDVKEQTPPQNNDAGQPLTVEEKKICEFRLQGISDLLSDKSSLEPSLPYTLEYIGEPNGEGEKRISYLNDIIPLDYFVSPVEEGIGNPIAVYNTVGGGCDNVETTESVPLFEDPQRMSLFILLAEQEAMAFGINVDPKASPPLVVQEQPFENPTLRAYTTNSVIENVFSSEDPLKAFAGAVSEDKIFIEAANPEDSARLEMAKLALKAIVSEKGLVEDSDCDRIKAEWAKLKKELDSIDCSSVKAELEQSQQRKNLLEKSLANLDKEIAQAEKDVEKSQKGLQDFLKNGMKDSEHSFEPPSDPQNWNHVGYPRHGTDIWFKGDGQKVIDFFSNWKKDIDAYKKDIEDAIARLENKQGTRDSIKNEMGSVSSEFESLQKALQDCLSKKKSIEEQMSALEENYKDCLKRIKEQERIDDEADDLADDHVAVYGENEKTGAMVGEFEGLDKQISGKQEETGIKTGCEDYEELQGKASYAQDEAVRLRRDSEAAYRSALEAYKNGDLEKADKLLKDSEELLRQARGLSEEARKKVLEAIAEKRACLSHIDGESARKAELEAQEAEWRGVLNSHSTVKDKPYYIDKDVARARLYEVLEGLIINEIGNEGGNCCPMKVMIAADRLVGEVWGDIFYKLGLGIMKAPIDALSPGGFAGKAAQKIVSYSLTYLGSDSLSEFAKNVIVSEVVERVLPGSGVDLIDKPQQQVTGDEILKLLSQNGVEVFEFGKDMDVQSRLCGRFPCNVKIVVFYNAHTRHMITLIKGDCCPELIMLSFNLTEDGAVDGNPAVRVLR